MIDPQEIGWVADELLGGGHAREWDVVERSDRGLVLRGSGVIVKHYGDRLDAFESEWQALHYAESRVPGLAPELIAASPENATLVISDVGDGPSLADALLGSDASEAVGHLDAYVDAIASLHKRTWGGPNRPGALHHDRPVSHYGLYSLALRLIREHESLPTGRLRTAALDEVEPLRGLATDEGPTVFSFGDMCPDNQTMTERGLQLFDLEASGFMHPALDLTYLIIPFPSCWCAWDLPCQIKSDLLDRYFLTVPHRDAVEEKLPDAEVFWTVIYVVSFFRADVSPSARPPNAPHAPTYRQVVSHRVDRTRTNPTIRSRFPAFCNLLDTLRSEVDQEWGDVPPLEVAPAFR